ncbi:hypothetical protein ACHAXT_005633 [Thalassiosira profunda]
MHSHCLGGSYEVTCGEPNLNVNTGQTFKMKREFEHPNYNSRTTSHDYAVVCVDGSFRGIRPVSLADSEPREGQAVVVLGHGNTKTDGTSLPNMLQEVTVNAMSRSECKKSKGYVGGFLETYDDVDDSMICARANGKDACQGDSGGPCCIMSGDECELVGIVSWGIGCASRDFPGVYANVAQESAWIRKQVENFGDTIGNSSSGNSPSKPTPASNPTPTPKPPNPSPSKPTVSGNNKPNPSPVTPATFDFGGGSNGGGGGGGGGNWDKVFKEDFKAGKGEFKNMGQNARWMKVGKWREGVLRVQEKGAATTGAHDVTDYTTCKIETEFLFINMGNQDECCIQYVSDNDKSYRNAQCVSPAQGYGLKRWHDESISINVKNDDKIKVRIQSNTRSRKNDCLFDLVNLSCK